MTMPTEAFPLCWPRGRDRTPTWRRERGRFEATFAVARDGLVTEVNRLGAVGLVISTDLPVRRDGLPLAGRAQPQDPGVAVYFLRKGKTMCFACDKYERIETNMRAIEKTIEALRGIERWGTGDMMEAAFSGFVALADESTSQWWVVLDLHPNATLAQAEDAYRRLRSASHPDRGGTAEKFHAIQRAWEQAQIARA